MPKEAKTKVEPTILSDEPIRFLHEDELGRADWAAQLGDLLSSYRTEQGVTIGITGDWGTGKTSTKNLIVHHLQTKSKSTLDICEFNPWQWGGQDQLASALFQAIENAFSSSSSIVISRWKFWQRNRLPKHLDAKRSANKFKLYAARLGVVSKMSNVPRQAIIGTIGLLVLFGIVSVSSVGGWLASPWVSLATWIVVLVGVLLMFASEMASAIAKAYDAKSLVHTKTPLEAKQDLIDALQKRAYPLIVFIDEIDRLGREEIRLLFQLVKNNLDLPYVNFVMLYQRSTVEEALTDVAGRSPEMGRRYLEKLVPIRYDLPPVKRSRLRAMIYSHLDALASQTGVTLREADRDRWEYLYDFGVSRYLWTLRDVKRFVNTVSFHIMQYGNGDAFEANFIDAIALEVLRLFEPTLHSTMRGHKDVLLIRSDAPNATDQVQSFLTNAPDRTRDVAGRIVGALFPEIGCILGHSNQRANDNSLLADRRVSHPRMFDLYFEMSLSEEGVSRTETTTMIQSTGERKQFEALVDSAIREGTFHLLSEMLTVHERDVPLHNVANVVSTLFDRVESFEDVLDYYRFVETLALTMSAREPDNGRRQQIIRRAVIETNSVFALGAFVARQEHKLAQGRADVGEHVLDDMRIQALNRIEEAVENEELVCRKGLSQILFWWEKWRSTEAVRGWAEGVTNSRTGLLCFLQGMVGISHTIAPVFRRNFYMDVGMVERWIDLEVLDKRVALLGELNEDEEQVIKLYLRKKRGFGADDDDDEV